MVNVYHNPNCFTARSTAPINISKCFHVATVQGEDLNHAYHLTNTIDFHWAEDDAEFLFIDPRSKADESQSRPLANDGHWVRSTCVGDVLVRITAEGMEAFFVAPVGFVSIPLVCDAPTEAFPYDFMEEMKKLQKK